MVPLLVLTALLLLGSGLLKARAAGRVGMGLPLLALAELLAGAGVLAAVLLAPLTAGQGLAVVVGSLALVVVSSLQVGLEVRRRQRVRTASEGARLANYVRYLSRPGPSTSAGGGQDTDQPERPR